jgi:hypothetical protein
VAVDLDAPHLFRDALGLRHGVAEVLFGGQLIGMRARVGRGAVEPDHPLSGVGQVGLVLALRLPVVLGVGGFGAFGLFARQPPHRRPTQLLLQLGDLPRQLRRLLLRPVHLGAMLGGLGGQPLPLARLPTPGALGVELRVGLPLGRITSPLRDAPPAPLDVLGPTLHLRTLP